MEKILIIDDEKDICESIKMILEFENYTADYDISSANGLEKLLTKEYAAAVVDLNMPDITGFDILKKAKEAEILTPIIILTAHGNIENAVNATKLGAFNFIEKPIDRDKLLISIRNAVSHYRLLFENQELKYVLQQSDLIIGKSKAIQNILETISKVAPTDVRVLITGENGVGKELVAREIHNKSPRSKNKLIEVNCAAIPGELIESELFGHEKGSFTGAHQQKIGKFELAKDGTLFLDEIGDMSLSAQAKVLRALEENKIERVGGTKTIEVNPRIIAATNKNLQEEIKKGNFREDLYHRLNVIEIYIPPLRERVEDIPLLADYFLKYFCEKYHRPQIKFAESAYKTLQSMKFTGNVRELRNLIERVVILSNKNIIIGEDIINTTAKKSSEFEDMIMASSTFQEFKEKAEKAFILKQLEIHNWNISKTAEALDIQRSHLYGKMKKYGILKEQK